MSEDFRVNHSGAQNFKPSCILADAATLSLAHDTCYVNFSTRFGERKKTGSETDTRTLAEILIDKDRQNSLQVPERDTLIHKQTFNLVEHW
jgi:hypothetical protein